MKKDLILSSETAIVGNTETIDIDNAIDEFLSLIHI